MIVAEWKAGARINADAEKVYQEIQTFGNSVTAEMVLKTKRQQT